MVSSDRGFTISRIAIIIHRIILMINSLESNEYFGRFPLMITFMRKKTMNGFPQIQCSVVALFILAWCFQWGEINSRYKQLVNSHGPWGAGIHISQERAVKQGAEAEKGL